MALPLWQGVEAVLAHEEAAQMLGVLALGAVPADELPPLTQHVETCDECRAELASLRDAVARLMFG